MFAGIIAAAAGAAGKKPQVPNAPSVNIDKETSSAYADIAKNLPQLQDIAAQINKASTDQLLAQWNALLPGFSGMQAQATKNTQSLLRGQLPADVVQNIREASAAAALRSGTSGSTFGYTYTPRSIGLTSLGLQQQGQQQFQSMAAQFKAPLFDYTNLFVNPMQRMAAQQWNESNRYQQQWAKNQIKAMPSPLGNAFMSFANNLDSMAWQAGGTFLGGAMTNWMTPQSGGVNGGQMPFGPTSESAYESAIGKLQNPNLGDFNVMDWTRRMV